MKLSRALIVVGGIVCITIFYLSSRNQIDKSKEVLLKEATQETVEPVQPRIKESAVVKQEAEPQEVPSIDEKKKDLPVITKFLESSEASLMEIKIDFEKLNKFYELQRRVDIRTFVKKLKPFDGLLSAEEKQFFGAFQGKLPSGSQKLRLNLEFNKSFDHIGREACLSVGDFVQGEYRILKSAERLRLFRTEEPGYLILVLDQESFLELYLTNNSFRTLQAYLTLPGDRNKMPLILNEKPQQYLGKRFSCEDFWEQSI